MIELFITVIVLGICFLGGKVYQFLAKEEAKDAESILKVGERVVVNFKAFDKVSYEAKVAIEAAKQSFLPLRFLAEGITYDELGDLRLKEVNEEARLLYEVCDRGSYIEELSPYEAGIAAYCLGKEEEDNPYHDDEELGTDWEAGYCTASKQDGRTRESDRGDI